MDFNDFNTVEAANRGSWLHIKSPYDGEPLYLPKTLEDGSTVNDLTKPCRVKVLGAEGHIAQEMVNEERRKMKGEDKPDPQATIRDQAARLLVGFENINNGDRPAKAPDDNKWFCSLQKTLVVSGVHPSFAEQIRTYSMTRMHDLGNVQGG